MENEDNPQTTFVPKQVFINLVKNLHKEIGLRNIRIVEYDGRYFKRESCYNSIVLICGQGLKSWDTVSKIRTSNAIKEFKEKYNAECVLILVNGVPRVKLNY